MSDGGKTSLKALKSRRGEMKKSWNLTIAVLDELRLEDKLCDVVIKVGDVQFNAHKIILCSCSQYFRMLFTSAWSNSEKRVYNIPGVSPRIMQLIITYAYTHSIPVTEDNVVEVLAAADQFWVPGIVQACCFFLEDQLCLENCIGIWGLVDFYHCPEMKLKVFYYILHHFEEIVCVSKEFPGLSLQQLAAVIENDQLNVRQENVVFEAVLHWINHLPDQRRGHIDVLLPKVRLCFMTTHYLQNSVINNPVVQDSVEAMRILDNAVMEFMDFRVNKYQILDYSNPLTRPRLPAAILLVTGGKHDITPNILHAYDPRSERWCRMCTDDICRSYHGAAVLNGFVYLIGGCSPRDPYLNTVQRFDPITRTWCELAPMNFYRCYVSVAVLNDCIYAMGGFDGHTFHNTVERYSQDTNQWTMVAPMIAKRSGASAATLNGQIYICGGSNKNHCIATAERYDPNTNQWTRTLPMRTRRNGLGVVAYKDRIYAVGGSNGAIILKSAEVYNPQTGRWTLVPSMSTPRTHFGIEVIDDQIFVVGGCHGSRRVASMERYDDETGMWYRAPNTNMACSGLSCSVLHGFYNELEKMFPRYVALTNVEETAGGSMEPSAQS